MNQADNEVRSLFDGLQARRTPPEAARARAFAAASAAFAEVQNRHRQRARNLFALAAVLTLSTLVGVITLRTPQTFSVQIAAASDLTINGVAASGERTIEVAPGDSLSAGEPARLALGQGTDLRLDRQTVIRWIGESSIELTQGSVFVDTGGVDDMSVSTSRGTVRDIGTQFLVTLDDSVMEVAVRSGRTIIDSDLGTYHASADGYSGDVVTLSADQASSRTEPTSADRWNWIHAVPRGYDDTAVARLLEQIAQDLGLRLQYADPGAEAWVMNLQLRGDEIDDLPPARALEVVAATSGLIARRGPDQTLTVSLP